MRKFQIERNTTKIWTAAITLFTFIALFLGSNLDTVFAQQTDVINTTRIVSSSLDKVWNIVSDVDKNSDYWPIKDIKNINKTDNIIEREVLTPPNNNKAHQVITINAEKFTIVENQTQGQITGVKTIKLIPVEDNKTRISILLNLDLSNIPIFVTGLVKDNIEKSVNEALNKIEKAIQ